MQRSLVDEVRSAIRNIPDFPVRGIQFKDITTVLARGPLFQRIIDHYVARYREAGVERIVAIESRGFVLGAALAYAMGIGLALVRKPGKLPYQTLRAAYDLEYGSDAVEIHQDAVLPGERVVLVDDLLATGGTAAAAVRLIRQLEGRVHEVAFLIELGELEGRMKLAGEEVYSLVTF
ncbi:MAG: adenine phosphoribosyltransferase [Bradymonadales bacterium]|nr:adenine phosphoribosyltransferase [Bradymonadales bacterium]